MRNILLSSLISFFFILSQEEFFYCVILEGNINHHLSAVAFNYAKSKYTHIYSEPGQVHLAYVVSVIDYNISLFRTVSRSNYAIIDYTMLQSPGIWNFPLASKAY
jgi:hypothetical protein